MSEPFIVDRILQALAVTGVPFAKYAWAEQPAEVLAWGVVTIDGEGASVWGGNENRTQALMGSVHLFIRSDGPEKMKLVQQALNSLKISWSLYIVQYEQDTRLIHYTWNWESEEAVS